MSDDTSNEASPDSTDQGTNNSLNVTGINARDLDIFGSGKAAIRVLGTLEKGCTGIARPVLHFLNEFSKAKSKITHAKADVKVQKILAGEPSVTQALHDAHTKNLSEITLKAIELEPEPESEEAVNPDWTMKFIGDAKNTSDEEMQALWARLLAGEISKPGSFSKRTLSIVKDLSVDDAKNFNQVCQLGFRTSEYFVLLIPGFNWPESPPFLLNYVRLANLESIGLVQLSSFGFSNKIDVDSVKTPIFMDDSGIFQLIDITKHINSGKDKIPTGHVKLSNAGKELGRIVERSLSEEYIEYVISFYKKHNIKAVFVPNTDASSS